MIMDYLRKVFPVHPLRDLDRAMDAEYDAIREELDLVGLDEEVLRAMDPDDRVAVLENAELDPYDYIYLAC